MRAWLLFIPVCGWLCTAVADGSCGAEPAVAAGSEVIAPCQYFGRSRSHIAPCHFAHARHSGRCSWAM